ncbi:uncharacterized protein K452DRAFT_2687 [Aplosporella prunicola CBS 121167]|uniref:Uncharacterized protein n=1 Tax=Aplosporella prunicola CBS 121167 TaxID=1176127 RepID=A0A6A6BWD9_9PEZI|nr:uncharacterized protein K452DRAFT_2687 [Aplosporella prunicola CBS 121167]KAF2147154.1 hypothetical protein K452DRAFT_2687 [Aplosporella prunicola CBS 121167]
MRTDTVPGFHFEDNTLAVIGPDEDSRVFLFVCATFRTPNSLTGFGVQCEICLPGTRFVPRPYYLLEQMYWYRSEGRSSWQSRCHLVAPGHRLRSRVGVERYDTKLASDCLSGCVSWDWRAVGPSCQPRGARERNQHVLALAGAAARATCHGYLGKPAVGLKIKTNSCFQIWNSLSRPTQGARTWRAQGSSGMVSNG